MPQILRKNMLSFCSDDKAGHRTWILGYIIGQKMMEEFLVPYYNYESVPHSCKDGGREQNRRIWSFAGLWTFVITVMGKRIQIDPLLDKQVKTPALSGR